MAGNVDLSSLLTGRQLTLKPEEHPEERAHRLARARRAAGVATAIQLTCLGLLVAAAVFAAWLVTSSIPAQSDFGQKRLFAIVSGAVGFVLGRQSAPKSTD
jgi:hypothetical protein